MNHSKTVLIRMQAEVETDGLDNDKFVVAKHLGNGKVWLLCMSKGVDNVPMPLLTVCLDNGKYLVARR